MTTAKKQTLTSGTKSGSNDDEVKVMKGPEGEVKEEDDEEEEEFDEPANKMMKMSKMTSFFSKPFDSEKQREQLQDKFAETLLKNRIPFSFVDDPLTMDFLEAI